MTTATPTLIRAYQQLLIYLLDRHYGLTLNDTPYGKEQEVIQNIEHDISVREAINDLVDKYELERIDHTPYSWRTLRPTLSTGDVLRARQATEVCKIPFPPRLLYPV